MKLTSIWIVTKPTRVSTVEDICFNTDAPGLALQFKGGLDPESIHAFYTSEQEAKGAAQWLILKAKES